MNLLNYSVFALLFSIYTYLVVEKQKWSFPRDIKGTLMLTPLYGSFVMGQHSVVDGRNHVE